MKKQIAILVFILLSLSELRAQWMQSPGPYGGSVRSIVANGNNVLAGTNSGIYRSTNNGASWTRTSLNYAYVFTVSGSTIWAASNAVYRSTDNGANWVSFSNGMTGTNIWSIATSGSNLFVGTYSGDIFMSSNGGLNWTQASNGLTSGNYVESIVISGTNVFAATHGGVYLSTNNGSSWNLASNGLPGGDIPSLDVNGNNIYAATGSGVYVTTNNGTLWTKITSGFTVSSVQQIAISGSNIFAGTYLGQVFVSTNNGASWNSASSGLPSNTIRSLYVSGNTVYAGTSGGVYLSTNNGSNWTAANNGLKVNTISAVAVKGNNLFAGTSDGAYLTNDYGSSWIYLNNTIGTSYNTIASSIINCFAISGNIIFAGTNGGNGLFSSSNNGTSWSVANSGFTDYHVWALAVSGQNLFAGTSKGVFLSTNYGSAWTSVSSGLPGTDVQALLANGTNLFAGIGSVVYLSTNNGLNWTPVNNGIYGGYVQTFAAIGSSVFAGMSNGVYLSTNNGTSWTAVNNGLSNKDVQSLAVRGTTLFAGTYGGGVYMSTDNGSSWTDENNGLTNTNVYSIAPSDSNLFIGTSEAVFYRPVSEFSPYIKVSNPSAGTSWYSSTRQAINWSSGRISGNVNIKLSTDGGNTYSVTLLNNTANDGTDSIDVPFNISSNCRIKVESVNDSTVFGLNPGNFSIVKSGTISLTSPNGAEVWMAGAVQNITWTSDLVNNVKIEYSINNGTTWGIVVGSTQAPSGSYSWTVPDNPSVKCKVRITDATNGNVKSVSANAFTLKSDNLLMNPSFETGINGNPDNWTAVNNGDMELARTNLQSHTGIYSISIGNVSGTTSGYSKWQSDLMNVEPSTQYSLSYWTYITKSLSLNQTQRLDVMAEFLDSSGNRAGGVGLNPTTVIPALWNNTALRFITNEKAARVRITVTFINNGGLWDGTAYFDDFELKLPTPVRRLKLLSPQENEILPAKGKYEIKWYGENISKVDIEYTYDQNTRYPIASGITGSQGTFTWTVPDSVTNSCLLNFTDYYDGSGIYIGRFIKIVRPTLQLVLPAGTEKLRANAFQLIRWTSIAVNNVKLEYTSDNGTTWSSIIESTPGSTGSCNWTVPNTPSTQCKIKISDADGSTGLNSVSNTFTITGPAVITVTTPAAGSDWITGTRQAVNWTSNNVTGNVNIKLSTDGGVTFPLTLSSNTANDGIDSIGVPTNISSSCRIKVEWVSDASVFGLNPGNFSIVKSGAIILKSPYGGENWMDGTFQNITWTSDLVADVKIEYSTNNGITWAAVVESTPAVSGSYSWVVPNTASNQCKIRITDANNINVLSQSNLFSIVKNIVKNSSFENGSNSKPENWTAFNNGDLTLEWTNVMAHSGSYSLNVGVARGTAPVTSYWVSDFIDVVPSTVYEGTYWIYANKIPASGQYFDFGTELYDSSGQYIYTNGGSVNVLQNQWVLNRINFLADARAAKIRFKISFYNNGSAFDGNAYFDDFEFKQTLPVKKLKLLAPAAGEKLTAGSAYDIKWESQNIPEVSLRYSPKGGGNFNTDWILIANTMDASKGTYRWIVPDTVTSTCNFIVYDASNSLIGSSLGNGYFSINRTTFITLNSPNGGENWPSGSKQDIGWSSRGVNNVKIEYSTDDGVNWNLIISSTPASAGSYSWTVLNRLSARCKIKITDVDNSSNFSISSAAFTISSPYTVTVNTPTGGTVFTAGSKQTLNWSSNITNNVNIRLSTDGGNTFSITLVSNSPNDGQEEISIPSMPSTACRIRVESVSDASIYGINPGNFTITANRYIASTSPASGEKWVIGSTKNISWTSSNISGNVNIRLSTDGGNSFPVTVISNTVNDGQEDITVPSIPSSSCRLRIESASDTSVYGLNPGNFTIIANSFITITTPSGGESWMAGSTKTISWTGSYLSGNLNIKLSVDDGQTYSAILASNTPNDGTEQITVPNMPSTRGRIKIESVDDVTIFAVSAVNFTITGTPGITINFPQGSEIFRAGTTQTITWSVSNIDKVKIEYSTDNGTNWLLINDSVQGLTGSYNWTIPAITAQQCRIKISDGSNSGFYKVTPVNFTIYTQPSAITLSYSLQSPDVTNVSSFRMIGVPGLTNYSISQLMKGSQGTDWQVFLDNGGDQNYFTPFDGSAAFNLKPGAGFWVVSRQPISVSGSVNSVTMDNNGSYSIPLTRGWNIISNPFEKSLNWNSIKSANGVTETIWDFNGSFASVTNFDPYKGYYFLNINGLSSLKIPYVAPLAKATALVSKATTTEIKIKLVQDNIEKSMIVIGFNSGASNGYDSLDLYRPVAEFEKQRIVVKNENLPSSYKYLFADYRAESDSQRYDLQLKLVPNQPYILKVESLMDDMGVCIIDKRLNNFYDLTNTPQIKLKSAVEENNYTLIVIRKGLLQEIKQKYEVPIIFSLEQNYPNPFNPSTVITYSIEKPGMVKLKVYDLRGREILSLVDEFQEAGRFSVQFSKDNLKLASGVYFYSLQSEGKISMKKLILLK